MNSSQDGEVASTEGLSPCHTAWSWELHEDNRGMNLKIPQATDKGYVEVEPYGAFDWTYPNSLTRRGRVQGGVISALPYCVRMRFMYMRQIPFNPMEDGTCRPIKSQYYKNGFANFVRGGVWSDCRCSVRL